SRNQARATNGNQLLALPAHAIQTGELARTLIGSSRRSNDFLLTSHPRTPAGAFPPHRAPPKDRPPECLGGVDEDVGIKADHHRSCISSRVKVSRVAPQGKPCAITLIACSM